MFTILLYILFFSLFDLAQRCVGIRVVQPIQQLKCIPNSLFVYDHNICFCDDKGQKVVCKRKINSSLFPELRSHQLQNLTIDCSSHLPGREIFNLECHSCICDDDHKHAICIPSDCDSKNTVFNKRDKCIPGSVFLDKCNSCICDIDGKAACTNLNCYELHGITQNKDFLCVPNYNFVFGCNECGCSKNGLSLSCEKIGCDLPNFVHEHLLNVTMVCVPRLIFRYNCQICVCSSKGTFAMCSGVQCLNQNNMVKARNTIEYCYPGIIFTDNCNVCICNANGKGVCTTLRCDIDYTFKYVDELTYSRIDIH